MSHPEFAAEISHNTIGPAPTEVAELSTTDSLVNVRLRGGFITDCELTSPTSGERVAVLYTDPDLTIPKLPASHVMSPVGKNEGGIGDQHGFPRWADYHVFSKGTEPGQPVIASFQAKRSDTGLGLDKKLSLTVNSLTSSTHLRNNTSGLVDTSLGEHLYFSLAGEKVEGLTVNGVTLDELLGDGASDQIMSGKPLFWADYSGQTQIHFPAGYDIKVDSEGSENDHASVGKVGMLIWHKKGTPSICFEPTLGLTAAQKNEAAMLNRYGSLELRTRIELL